MTIVCLTSVSRHGEQERRSDMKAPDISTIPAYAGSSVSKGGRLSGTGVRTQEVSEPGDSSGVDSLCDRSEIGQGSTSSTLAKIGAGALIGVTLAASLASAAPLPQNEAPRPSQEPAATLVITEEAQGPAKEYLQGSDNPVTIQRQDFPSELRLDAEKSAPVTGISGFEDEQVFRMHTNLEYHEALRIDVFRPIFTEQVEAPPEVKPPAAPSLDAAGTPVNTVAQPAEASSLTTTRTRPRDLTPFGVDLGNGLFYDLNGNLTFNPLRVVGAFGEATVDPAGFFNTTTVRSDGNRMTIDRPGLFNSIDIVKSPGKIVLDQPGFWNDTITITQRDGRTTVDPPGLNTWLGQTEITQEGNRVTYDPPGVLNSTTITGDGHDTRIAIPGWANDVTITEEGNTIRIKYPGWANDTTITRQGDRILIDPAGWGNSISISRTGNEIRVDPTGLNNSTIITIH